MNCPMCGDEFRETANGQKKFCSTKCSVAYRKPLIPVKIVTLIRCQHCGQLMKPHQGVEKKFCSRNCGHRARRARA